MTDYYSLIEKMELDLTFIFTMQKPCKDSFLMLLCKTVVIKIRREQLDFLSSILVIYVKKIVFPPLPPNFEVDQV